MKSNIREIAFGTIRAAKGREFTVNTESDPDSTNLSSTMFDGDVMYMKKSVCTMVQTVETVQCAHIIVMRPSTKSVWVEVYRSENSRQKQALDNLKASVKSRLNPSSDYLGSVRYGMSRGMTYSEFRDLWLEVLDERNAKVAFREKKIRSKNKLRGSGARRRVKTAQTHVGLTEQQKSTVDVSIRVALHMSPDFALGAVVGLPKSSYKDGISRIAYMLTMNTYKQASWRTLVWVVKYIETSLSNATSDELGKTMSMSNIAVLAKLNISDLEIWDYNTTTDLYRHKKLKPESLHSIVKKLVRKPWSLNAADTATFRLVCFGTHKVWNTRIILLKDGFGVTDRKGQYAPFRSKLLNSSSGLAIGSEAS